MKAYVIYEKEFWQIIGIKATFFKKEDAILYLKKHPDDSKGSKIYNPKKEIQQIQEIEII